MRQDIPVITVPITPSSTRKYKLMEEDYIELVFNLAEPLTIDGERAEFQIGDYIDDELFGRFFITQEPAPAEYSPSTGAYRYTLRFDREYIGWTNRINFLTYIENGQLYRRESNWNLTAPLSQHVQVIIDNLQVLGKTYTFNIDSAEKAGTACEINYDGASILDSLNAIANAYSCEWWVIDHVIYFGRCENGDAISLELGVNVQNASPTRDENGYYNRIYAFGSTKNVPDTYRKELIFTVDDYSVGDDTFRDSKRAITSKNLEITQEFDASLNATLSSKRYQQNIDFRGISKGTYNFQIKFVVQLFYADEGIIPNPDVSISGDGITWSKKDIVTNDITVKGSAPISEIIVNADGYGFTDTNQKIIQLVVVERSLANIESYRILDGGILKAKADYVSADFRIIYKGYTYTAHLNEYPKADNSNKDRITCDELPNFMKVGDTFEIAGDSLDITTIPTSWYTNIDGDPNNLRQLGERRLMLPIGTPFVGPTNIPPETVVEKVVLFEDIYPRCALRITEVTRVENDASTQWGDGSRTKANLPIFTIRAMRITPNGDIDFPFKNKYKSSEEPFQLTFLSQDEEKKYTGGEAKGDVSRGYQLQGMTFGVEFFDGQYTILWNSNYGKQLPNDSLYPKVGDSFVLSGWNVTAMQTLGLIDSAEQELLQAATEYQEALKDAAFSFDLNMMSDWAREHGVPNPGQVVAFTHGAMLKAKRTRVLGYELKLDIPWDTPTWTIGDASAYSRLRDLEKRISEVQSTTVSSTIQASSSSGGGGSTSDITVLDSASLGDSLEEDNTKVFNAAVVNNIFLTGVALGNKVGEVTE